MRATVGQKRGKWGLRIYYGNREKWRTIGEGDEALEKARKLAEAANAREDRQRQNRRGGTGFLEWHRRGSPLPIDRLLTDWLRHYGPSVGPSTFDRYRAHCKDQLIPFFGAKDLARLQDTDIITWAAGEYDQGRGRDTVVNATRCLVRIARLAHQKGHLERSPVPQGMVRVVEQIARARDVNVRAVDAWNLEEVQTLLMIAEETEPHFAPVLQFAFLTGCRRGEIMALRWDKVDLERGTIQVEKSEGRYGRRNAKWGKHRTIDLPRHSLDLLERLAADRSRRPDDHDSRYVFVARRGRRWSVSSWQRTWTRIRSRANALDGTRSLNFHATRHTHASVCLDASESPTDVANRLGHGIDVLHQRYAHLLRKHRQPLRHLDALSTRAPSKADRAPREAMRTPASEARSGRTHQKTWVDPPRPLQ